MIAADLTGSVALVTGASSGLGRHFALLLARSGAKVAVAARRVDALDDLVSEIESADGRAIAVALDVTDAQSIARAVEVTETELGPLSILVNNAGIASTAPAVQTSAEDWDRVMDTNLRGVFLMASEVARHLVRFGRPGSIVNVGSVLGIQASQQVPAYAASKAGVLHLTRALAIEWARHNIRVNALAPGYIETDLNRDFLKSPAGAKLMKSIPQRRFGRPEDLDGPLLLLVSSASAFMTGAVLVADGGQTVTL